MPVKRRAMGVIASVALMLAMLAPAGAEAQERVPRRTLLQMLFGTPQQQEAEPIPEPGVVRRQNLSVYEFDTAPQVQPKAKPVTRKKKTAPVAVAPEEIAKLPDARKVLVVGDFLAGGLGEGLKTAFETTPGIAVDARSNVSSGIVRDDYFDWQATLPGYITEEKPDLVIISLGANDRQPLRVGETREKPFTEGWTGEYRRRIQALIALAKAEDRPLIWVGLPPFQSTAMTADAVTLNGLFRAEVEEAGGTFVDIWDGFVDESGAFVLTGSDINGQQVRLRGQDGISLTKAGKRKLAFYLEEEIRDKLGVTDRSARDDKTLSKDDSPALEPAETAAILRTPPIGLADPELDGGTALIDASMTTAAKTKTPRDLLVESGETGTAPAGRIDDFRLAKPGTVISNPVIRN